MFFCWGQALDAQIRKVSSGYPQCISECVNALSGLSCYLAGKLIKAREVCFNALTGLSCYGTTGKESESDWMFQCPHGLELLLWKMIAYDTKI